MSVLTQKLTLELKKLRLNASREFYASLPVSAHSWVPLTPLGSIQQHTPSLLVYSEPCCINPKSTKTSLVKMLCYDFSYKHSTVYLTFFCICHTVHFFKVLCCYAWICCTSFGNADLLLGVVFV